MIFILFYNTILQALLNKKQLWKQNDETETLICHHYDHSGMTICAIEKPSVNCVYLACPHNSSSRNSSWTWVLVFFSCKKTNYHF